MISGIIQVIILPYPIFVIYLGREEEEEEEEEEGLTMHANFFCRRPRRIPLDTRNTARQVDSRLLLGIGMKLRFRRSGYDLAGSCR